MSYLYVYAEQTGHLRFFCSDNVAFPRERLIERLAGFEETFPFGRGAFHYWSLRRAEGSNMRVEPGRFFWGMMSFLLMLPQAASAVGYYAEAKKSPRL